MNILFICKWNRFRSKIAEELFKKYNKKHKVKSAGIVQGHLPLDKTEVKVAKKLGVNLKGKPHGLTSKLMVWQNIIVIVANDVPKSLFAQNKYHGKKTIAWKIRDNKHDGEKEIEKIIKKIDKKVKKFAESLL